MEFKYAFLDNYNKPVKINMHFHSCFEIVYYHYAKGISQWKPSSVDCPDALKFVPAETGQYQYLEFHDNTFVIYPPNILHNEQHTKPSKLTALGFSLSILDLPSEIFNLFEHPKVFQDKDARILDSLKLIEKEYIDHNDYFNNVIECQIKNILINIGRAYKVKPFENSSIKFSKSYIDENFTKKIDLNELAALSNYSSDHFRILFKQFVGINPKEYIQEKRLELAKTLLSQKQFSLETISELCGFSDYVQFHKFFKKRTKTIPKNY